MHVIMGHSLSSSGKITEICWHPVAMSRPFEIPSPSPHDTTARQALSTGGPMSSHSLIQTDA